MLNKQKVVYRGSKRAGIKFVGADQSTEGNTYDWKTYLD